MLIGFDASRAFLKESTGTENYSFNLLKALAKIDTKNDYLIYIRYSENLVVKKFFPKNFQFKVIKPYRLWTQVGLALETWTNPVDVLFIPAHTLPILRRRSFMVNGLLGKGASDPNEPPTINHQHSTKYVVTIHDLGVEYLPGFHKFPDKYYLDFASRYAASNADLVIAVSEETKKDLIKRYKIDQSNILVINEGVDKNFFKQTSIGQIKSVKNKYKICGNYFLFVGTIQPRKNLLMLIDAFAQFVKIYIEKNNISKYDNPDHHEKSYFNFKKSINSSKNNNAVLNDKFFIPKLVICGKKGWDYQEVLNRPIELGISDLILFLDYVAKSDLPALYSGAVTFLYPSLFEGFGLPILESLACCCPIIASNIGPHREIFSEIKKDAYSNNGSSSFSQESVTANKRAYSKKGFAYFSQIRNKRAYLSMTPNNSRKKDKEAKTSNLMAKIRNSQYFERNRNLVDFEAMSLVDPRDQDQWSRFLYLYISMYNRQISLKRPRILPKKSYNWDEVARKTLNVFEKVFSEK